MNLISTYIFITNNGLYYYIVILFGLKNDGAMYQCFMNSKVFDARIGKQIEVYNNDMNA